MKAHKCMHKGLSNGPRLLSTFPATYYENREYVMQPESWKRAREQGNFPPVLNWSIQMHI